MEQSLMRPLPGIRLKTALLITAGLMLFLVSCVTETSQLEATVTPVPPPERPRNPTYEVSRGEVVDRLQFSGRVSPVLEEQLFFRTAGRIRDIYVERYDEVPEGQLLADLEIVEDLERQLAADELALRRAQINVSMAELALERTNAQSVLSEDEIALAEANLEAAQARFDAAVGTEATAGNLLAVSQVNLEKAESSLADAQEAYDTAWDPGRDWELDIDYRRDALENERESSARRLEQAERDLRAAQANYNLTAGALNNEDSVSARAALVSAQQALKLAQAGLGDFEAKQRNYELELAKISLEEAQLGKEDLQAAIADAQIHAPFDGQVLLLSASEGRSVDAYGSIMVIADLTQLEISADLTRNQLEGLVEGMPVTVALVNRPGESLSGIIRRLPYRTPGNSSSVEDEDDSTRIMLDVAAEEAGLDLGDLTQVTAVIERKDDVLWLPPQAVRSFEGRSFVVIQDGDVQRRVDVTTGIEGDGRVEIEDGLTEGQIVAAP